MGDADDAVDTIEMRKKRKLGVEKVIWDGHADTAQVMCVCVCVCDVYVCDVYAYAILYNTI